MAQNTKFSMLKKRSRLLQQLRAFFYARSVIEVDTPMLSVGGVPDCHLSSLTTLIQVPGERDPKRYYLHTSPEYPMKRLLCEGGGDIFYLGKVFRDGDLSPRHQVEFMMLEWYRLDFSMFELIEEVILLIQQALKKATNLTLEKLTYQQAFLKYAGMSDILSATAEQCRACLTEQGGGDIVGVDAEDKALWEQLILTEIIEPQLGVAQEGAEQGLPAITVLYHFPASQAALAQVSLENPRVSERFEVFVNGMELANGYHELQDATIYRNRFNESLAEREQLGFSPVTLDEKLLDTLEKQPLPNCSGVALGVDRLFALQQGFKDIEEGIAFGLLRS